MDSMQCFDSTCVIMDASSCRERSLSPKDFLDAKERMMYKLPSIQFDMFYVSTFLRPS